MNNAPTTIACRTNIHVSIPPIIVTPNCWRNSYTDRINQYPANGMGISAAMVMNRNT